MIILKKIKANYKLFENQTLNTHLNSNNNCMHNIFTKQKSKGDPYIFFCTSMDEIKGGKPANA
jgi:hypothetical protein